MTPLRVYFTSQALLLVASQESFIFCHTGIYTMKEKISAVNCKPRVKGGVFSSV